MIDARKELENRYEQASTLLGDVDELEKFLQRLEEKLKVIPKAGEKLSEIPVLVSLIRSYVKKEYKEVPLGTIIAALAALIYVVSPVDVIPDGIPMIGYTDDVAVVAICWELIGSDVEEYRMWRVANNKVI